MHRLLKRTLQSCGAVARREVGRAQCLSGLISPCRLGRRQRPEPLLHLCRTIAEIPQHMSFFRVCLSVKTELPQEMSLLLSHWQGPEFKSSPRRHQKCRPIQCRQIKDSTARSACYRRIAGDIARKLAKRRLVSHVSTSCRNEQHLLWPQDALLHCFNF